ncbi:MAG: hypothetical protein R3296_04355 [Oleiphilaceae bacterium]|nr:hypothetical protein [Oleiphilaceae bacterium]
MTRPRKRRRPLALIRPMALTVAFLGLSGCGGFHLIYTPVGQGLSGYARDHATPYVLAMDDVGMACEHGLGVEPLLYSFSRVTHNPDLTGTLLQVLGGICGERDAVEEELRYLRASYHNNISEMQDARSSLQRRYAINAKRRLLAYERSMAAFDFDPTQPELDECPPYRNNQDELTFMLGLLSGLQAVMDDARSGGRAGVSRGLAMQVERAATCLGNKKWGGMPGNLRALVWTLLPDSRPDGIDDPWQFMAENRQLAMDKGVRTAMVLELVMAENLNRTDTMAEVLSVLAESEGNFTVSPDYRLVDSTGMEVARFVSDRLWTRRYGHATPSNRFGRISKDREPGKEIDTEGLL